MNTKYNTPDEGNCEKESEISREMSKLEQSIEVLNHRITNALTNGGLI